MDVAPGTAVCDPDATLEVRASSRFIVASLVGGLVAVGIGLALEYGVYRRLDPFLPGFVPRIKGWWFVGLGAIFTWIGLQGLISRPILLKLDPAGLHSPKQKLSIPWDRIREVRGVVLGGGRYLGVTVNCPGEIPGVKANRLKYWAVLKAFGQDEVPIGMVGGELNLEAAVAAVEAHLTRWRDRSATCSES